MTNPRLNGTPDKPAVVDGEVYDYIIVGGGTAGTVLANRLSSRASNKVLVCEAGHDTPPGKVPPEILDSHPGRAYMNPKFTWPGLKVYTEVISHNRPEGANPRARPYLQARVMGGGSSINGQMANRGSPADYDEWAERGAAGWDWEGVLPYFKKLERDMDFDGPLHGKEGRIPITRIFPDLWSEHARAIGRSLVKLGYKYLPDQNGEFEDGYFPLPIANIFETRVSAPMGYLDPVTRMRPNLRISPMTQVLKLIFEGRKCIGVTAMVDGREVTFRGNEIIVSSGAIYSPTQLLRSGVGPAGHLKDLGIPVVHDLPGVGQGLMDHPAVAISAFVKPFARMNHFTRRHHLLGLRFTSSMENARQGDMFVVAATKSFWHAVGQQFGSMVIWANKAYSETGQVRLGSADWRDQPIVEFNLLSDRRDFDRLVEAMKLMARVHEDPEMEAVATDAFPAIWGDRVQQFGEVNLRNKLFTDLAARMLDGPKSLHNFLMRKFVWDRYSMRDILEDNEKMEDFVRQGTIGLWHASSSCRMGDSADRMAVVNPNGRVRGVGGLRICDTSIFPVIPSANTFFPAMMAAEKISDAILAGN